MKQLNLYDITTVAETARLLADIYPDPLHETSRRKYGARVSGHAANTRFWEDVETHLHQNHATPASGFRSRRKFFAS